MADSSGFIETVVTCNFSANTKGGIADAKGLAANADEGADASSIESADGTRVQVSEEGQCTWVGGCMNLIKACIGSGILALPYANNQAGWAVGVFTLFFAAATAFLGMVLLTRCAAWMHTRPSSYGKLCEMTFPRIAFLVDICILLACFGACLSYLVIMGDLLPKVMVAFGAAEGSIAANRTLWLSIFFVVFDVPLTCLRNIDKLSYSSGVAFVSLVYVVLLGVLFLIAPAPSLDPCASLAPEAVCRGETVPVSTTVGFLRALPTFIFAYVAHFIIFNIYDSLRKPTVRKMEMGVVAPSMSVVTVIYGVFGLCGYFTYGSALKSNILVNYPPTAPVIVAQFVMSFVVAVSYPLCMHATRAALLNLVKYATDAAGKSEHANSAYMQNVIYWSSTVGLLALSYVIAIFVTDLGMIIGLVGVICGVPIGYILPGVFYCKVFGSMREKWDPKHVTTMEDRVLYGVGVFLVVFGVVFLPLALVFMFI